MLAVGFDACAQFEFVACACRSKMVEGRVAKTFREQCLLEQPFWKDESITVADVLKAAITGLGENIKARQAL